MSIIDTNTPTTQHAGIVGHALTALGHHITTNNLTAPSDLQFDDELTRIEFTIPGSAAGAWRRSLHGCVDNIVRDTNSTYGLEWVTLTGRLPDTGVRIQIEWMRALRPIDPRPVHVAGVAR